jgi:hypothetical protein
MATPQADHRSPSRKAKDEQIAAEPHLPAPQLPPDSTVAPVEAYLPSKSYRPLVAAGLVENGLVRPLDPAVKLPEDSRVIIVASSGT